MGRRALAAAQGETLMYGFRGMGDPATGQPDTFSAADIASLVPPVGPDQSAPLQVGALAQQTSSSGQYSLNPSTGQLQQNLVPGFSNTTLLWIGGGIFGV